MSSIMHRIKKSTVFVLLRRLFKEKPLGTFGLFVILLLLFTGIFADVLAPYGFNESDISERLSPPSATHILGTDNNGRDMFSRIIYGARISMIVSLSASAISIFGQLVIGTISGYFGGKLDLFIQRLNDSIQAVPALLLVLSLMAVVGQGMIQVILVLGLRSAFTTRSVRSFVVQIKENAYFEASRAIGASHARIIIRHIVPNIIPMVIVSFSLIMGRFILQEATLSFLGFGVPPPFPSWGGMMSGSGRAYMLDAPWMLLWPGLALFLVIFGINMFGDALRDLLDPRLRGGVGRYGSLNPAKIAKIMKKRGVSR